MRKTFWPLVRKLFGTSGGRPRYVDLRWGDFRRLAPFSTHWGADQGQPFDRFYIEKFLSEWRDEISGAVLEVGDPGYTRTFGGERVVRSDVLHVCADAPNATIIGDLSSGENIPSAAFDCFIITQTLMYVYDLRAAIETIHRSLKPGGVVLATMAGISHTPVRDPWTPRYCWTFTPVSARRLFCHAFEDDKVTVRAYGNVLTASAFLWGLPLDALSTEEVEHCDADYPLVVTVRAQKAT